MYKLTKRLSELMAKAVKTPWTKSHDEGYGHDLCIGSEYAFDDYRPADHEARYICDVRGPARKWGCPSESTKANADLIVETINALPKLLEIIRIQGEALASIYQPSNDLDRDNLYGICVEQGKIAKQALQEIKRIENETNNT